MQLNAEHPLPVEVRPVRERKLLRTEHFHAALIHCLAHELRKALACAEHAHRYIARNAFFRRLDIARVGQQERPVERYEHRAVCKGKARCIALIKLICYKHRVKPEIYKPSAYFCKSFHCVPPSQNPPPGSSLIGSNALSDRMES